MIVLKHKDQTTTADTIQELIKKVSQHSELVNELTYISPQPPKTRLHLRASGTLEFF